MNDKSYTLAIFLTVGFGWAGGYFGGLLMAKPETKVNTITLTNYVTMPAEFGPDGYGFRHLAKDEYELVNECKMQMDNPWERGTFFADLMVVKTVTHDLMTASEIIKILSVHPGVASVSLALGAKRSVFSLNTLAHPQYENEYRLTKAQWKSLQDYCRLSLIDPIAAKEVEAHWRSITNGVVPFGLRVME